MQFAYVRVSTKNQSTDSQTTDIQSSFPNAQFYTDFAVSGTVAAMERPELSKVLLQLRAGDELIVWWIDRLGRNYQEIENLIRELLQKGVTIRTINQNLTFVYTGEDLQDMTTNIQLTMITAMAAAERKNRLASAEAGRKALKQEGATNKKGQTWSEAFAGRKQNKELQNQIIELLTVQRMSVRKIAEALGCSPTTVQKVRKEIMNQG